MELQGWFAVLFRTIRLPSSRTVASNQLLQIPHCSPQF
eukprot:CAMPEP_0177733900 /NCGR_PEP_ID=MMETSP0484_2-20121128/23936_1 /TAXON_ID=354590 /ORGANISM="Rhodomonas lens, Strain RHODO" /LENGTH=37 /DNA_ID= /DNA_START= /DNA_END= /DNA_ORIENTATION=